MKKEPDPPESSAPRAGQTPIPLEEAVEAAAGTIPATPGATPSRFCVNCGHAMRPTDAFCGYCGTAAWQGDLPGRPATVGERATTGRPQTVDRPRPTDSRPATQTQRIATQSRKTSRLATRLVVFFFVLVGGVAFQFLLFRIPGGQVVQLTPVPGASTIGAPETRAARPSGPPRPSAVAIPAPLALEPGWSMMENQSTGVAMALPPDWRMLTPAAYVETLKTLGSQDAQAAQMLRSVRASDFSYAAVDLSRSGNVAFHCAVTVTAAQVGPQETLDSLETGLVKNVLQTVPLVAPPATGRVTLPAGEAVQIRTRMRTAGLAGQEPVVSNTLYWFLEDGKTYAVLFTAPDSEAAQAGAVFDKMIATLRLPGRPGH